MRVVRHVALVLLVLLGCLYPAAARAALAVRPTTTPSWPKACSFRRPACVSAEPGTPPAAVLSALGSVERAWDALTGPMALPPPDRDPTTRAYDVFLVARTGLPNDEATTVASERDAVASFDRASAYTLVDRKLTGCALDATIARELARAILWRVAPATDEGTARGATSYLARLAVPCAMSRVDDVDVFQARPDRMIVDTWRDDGGLVAGLPYARGSSLFWWWLDDSFGGAPGAIVRASWALSPTSTPLGDEAKGWKDDPDGFDVLRVTFKNALSTGSTLDDLLLAFGVARAFVGTTADDLHLAESRTLGDAGRVRRDWDVPWPTKPRRLAPSYPVAPGGASYVAVRREGRPPGARLRIEATWEEHAKMRWMAVKLDAAGHEKGRVLLPVFEKAVEVQGTVAELDDVETVLIVAVNAGDPSFKVDPDDAVWEPHGYLVSIASE